MILILFNIVYIAIVLVITLKKSDELLNVSKAQMEGKKGVNREITDGNYAEELAVSCDNGTFVGLEKNGVRSYRGIPYAMPPTGERRWKRPVDAPESDGVFEAFYYGKSAIQTEAWSERASLYYQGEDCLTLNVFTGSSEEANEAGEGRENAGKPVMVFFPGGAYGWGGTADPLYDGQNFAEAHGDVVLVTVNYRVGLMGFLDLSIVEGGDDFSESGNLGLLDQISALRWVKRNIRAFGGDPDLVTIFGESAGGSSVSLLPLMEEAKGLFRRAIAESGSVAFTYSREECLLLTEKLLEMTKASSMDELLALSEDELIDLNKELNDYNNFPERDGVILPEDLYALYDAGAASDIEMMSGTNSDEARYWIDEVGGYPVFRVAGPLLFRSTADRIDKEDKKYVRAFMELQEDASVWNATEFINELVFRVPAIRQAAGHASSGGKHFMYYWTKESAIPHYGACHAVELAYVFNNVDDTIFTGEKADETLAHTVQEMWVNFAKTGDPSTEEYKWEPYDLTSRPTMILGDEISLENDPLSQQRVLIEPLLKYRFNGYYKSFDYALYYVRRILIRAILVLAGINVAAAFLIRLRRRKKSR